LVVESVTRTHSDSCIQKAHLTRACGAQPPQLPLQLLLLLAAGLQLLPRLLGSVPAHKMRPAGEAAAGEAADASLDY
jgi:hypothetical protein